MYEYLYHIEYNVRYDGNRLYRTDEWGKNKSIIKKRYGNDTFFRVCERKRDENGRLIHREVKE